MSVEKVITNKFKVCFPNVFSPNNFQGKETYGLTMLFDNEEDTKNIQKLAQNAAVEKWGEKAKKMKLDMPVKQGNDKDLDKYPLFEDKYFANAKSKFQCGLVDQKRQEILDESEFYAGCFARAAVTAYAWEYMGKKGVSLNLANVQKLADGEPLGSRRNAADDFDAVESEGSDDDWGDEEI